MGRLALICHGFGCNHGMTPTHRGIPVQLQRQSVAAGARPTDVERLEARTANGGGFSFLLVHGVTWIAAGVLSFVLPRDTAALVYLFQGFVAFPASLIVERVLGYRTLATRENSLVSLFVLVAVAQGLALPASIIVYNLDPRLVPVVFAATNGGHFLPYSWLHGTRAYIGLAVVAALGPFAVVVAADADAAFHTSGFIVGGALLATALWVRFASRARMASGTESGPGR
jgi:hypothetical protein